MAFSKEEQEGVIEYLRLKNLIDRLSITKMAAPDSLSLIDVIEFVSESLSIAIKFCFELNAKERKKNDMIIPMKTQTKEEHAFGLEPMKRVKFKQAKMLQPRIWEEFFVQMQRLVRGSAREALNSEGSVKFPQFWGETIKALLLVKSNLSKLEKDKLMFLAIKKKEIDSLFISARVKPINQRNIYFGVKPPDMKQQLQTAKKSNFQSPKMEEISIKVS